MTTEEIMRLMAPKFSTASRYVRGSVVLHDDALWTCTSPEHHGEWDPAHFARTSMAMALSAKAPQQEIAPAFSYEADYDVGKLAIRDSSLVECVGAGRGMSAAFASVTVSGLIDRLRREVRALRDELRATQTFIEAMSNSFSSVKMETIAPPWAPGRTYKDGQMVSRNGKLYCCISGHKSGSAWDIARWTETSVADVMEGMTEAFSAAIRNKAGKA